MIESLAAFGTALAEGAALASAYNPLASLIGAAVTAAVLASGSGARRAFAAVSALTGFWLVGDGLRVIARLRDLVDGVAAGSWETWIAVALWGLGGFALGYALPAWAGAFAGRRVLFGTGWLTAVVVAVSSSAAIAAIAAAGG